MSADADRRLVRPLAYLLLAGAVVIWIGLAIRGDNLQLIGEAVCVGGFVRLAVAGWRISRDR